LGAKIVKTCKMNFKNIQALLFSFYVLLNFYFIITFILFFSIFILYFYYYIFYLQKKTNNSNLNYISFIKDKEYLLFRNSLINFYSSTLIILFYFLFKNNGLNYILELNSYFIYLILNISIFYFFLFSNYFTLKLFNLYKEIKNFINLFNETFSSLNLNPFSYNIKKINKNILNLKRNYSTLPNSLVETEVENPNENLINIEKNRALKEFKKNIVEVT